MGTAIYDDGISERQRFRRTGDAADLAANIAGERTVDHGQRSSSRLAFDTAAHADASIAEERAVGHGHLSLIVFDPAALAADIVGERVVVRLQRSSVIFDAAAV